MKRSIVLILLSLACLPWASWANPVISEFLANPSTEAFLDDDGQPKDWIARDSDGDAVDWIEIHNPGPAELQLGGYYLTDSAEFPDQWRIPDQTLAAGGHLLIFASGKDRVDSGELHANFRLEENGEYLALIAPDGVTVVDAFDPGFPNQRDGVSYGRFGAELHYFLTPTPRAANGAGVLGFVADTKFNAGRGFYDEPFEVEITTETEGAEIWYFLDGRDPRQGSIFTPAIRYTGPVPIETTTVLRAFARKPGYEPANTDSQTYIFPDHVATQPRLPEGFPERWNATAADYEMDPDITGPYGERLRESLESLPVVSVATATDNLFGTGNKGIYANPEQSGVSWERPVSVEWFYPDGTTEFQIDCGLRIQGGYFRGANATQKHSFRFLFKTIYGPGRLRHDVFKEPGAATSFDTLTLRAGANDGYSWDAARDTEQFTRDEFGRRLQLDMGHPAPRGTFVHLYLNGLYWGLYNLCERPNEDFSADYYGGNSEDWTAVNSGEVKQGSLNAWTSMIGQIRTMSAAAEYERIQGNDPDGLRNPDYPVLFDEVNYIDYMILNIWGGNWDWPNKNFWFGRLDTEDSAGFKFYTWDFENTMGNDRGRSPLNMVSPRSGIENSWVGEPHNQLKDLAEYRIAFSDRVYRHFFREGLLTPQVLLERYEALAASVEGSIVAESARWGDDHHSQPQTIEDWLRERDWLLNTYLPQRSAIVLNQFRNAKLYPEVDPPVLDPPGGVVPPGATVQFVSPEQDIYYTTDGTDPYWVDPVSGLSDPAPSALASTAGGSIVIDGTTTVKARVFRKSLFGSRTWSALSETVFFHGTDGLVISALMYHPPEPSAEEIAAGFGDANLFEYVELRNVGGGTIDWEGLRFTDGLDFSFAGTLLPGASAYVVADLEAFRMRYGDGHTVVGVYSGRLNNAGERLELTDARGTAILAFGYHDEDPWPEDADGLGSALVLKDPLSQPDPADPGNWMAGPPLAGGSQGLTLEEWMFVHGISDPDEDEDEDGLSAFAEYALGTDPGRAGALASLPMVRLETLQVGGHTGRFLVFRYPRRAGVSDVIWSIEGSADLQVWTPVDPDLVTEGTRPGALPGQEEAAFRLEPEQAQIPDAVAPALYYRLRMKKR
ncbi:MAG TPA: CotH kinase family protein [Verrucomicrobiales bacterium]|nr:CotH kinase family protein [Verrucomicrobiales bacterium]